MQRGHTEQIWLTLSCKDIIIILVGFFRQEGGEGIALHIIIRCFCRSKRSWLLHLQVAWQEVVRQKHIPSIRKNTRSCNSGCFFLCEEIAHIIIRGCNHYSTTKPRCQEFLNRSLKFLWPRRRHLSRPNTVSEWNERQRNRVARDYVPCRGRVQSPSGLLRQSLNKKGTAQKKCSSI